jgi:DNA-binding MarR family transcriptional regulator
MSRLNLKQPAGIEDLLLFRMHKVIALGGGVVTRICEGHFGITRREWTVLAILARADAMAWTEAAQRCELDDARLSRAVSSLAEKGLLQKSHLPDRQVVLALTAEGKELYAAIYPLAYEVHVEMLKALDDDLVAALEDALQRLHDQAEELVRKTDVPKARRSRGGRRGL